MLNTRHIVIAISLLVLGHSEPRAEAQTADEQDMPRFVVFGVDRSESWTEMTQSALKLAEKALSGARPGDEITYRWISDKSYHSSEVFAHVRLPRIAKAADMFDKAAKRRRRAALVQFHAERKRALEQLRSQHPEAGTPSTDIYGFLTAAAEHFTQAPTGLAKTLIVVSDMKDNRRYEVQPELSGVEVQVYLVVRANADPTTTQRLKDHWTEYLARSGTRSVSFLPLPAEVIR